MKTSQGYYRYPTLHRDTIVFVSEDDLWAVSADGGVARRLTSNLGEVSRPSLSPDGKSLAFVGREEGVSEIYWMPALGGEATRLTYLGSSLCLTAGWTPDGKIVFASNAGHWYAGFTHLYMLDVETGDLQKLDYGLARSIAYGANGGVVLGRNTAEPARWKRYRGGYAGQLWIDENGSGAFRRLLPELSNLASPMWLDVHGDGGRIYFISDHEGVSNLYSCFPDGEDLRRHTHHEDYYVRNASSDGQRIVYHSGGDLFLFDPADEQTHKIDIGYYSPRVQRNRKFVTSYEYLDECVVSPSGQATALVARGRLFSFFNWEGAVVQHDEMNPIAEQNDAPPATTIRYRLPGWLPDGKRLIAVTDSPGEETFIIFQTQSNSDSPRLLERQDFGRPLDLAVNPRKDQILFSNHRYELLFLDLQSSELRLIDRGVAAPISGFCWSPDGEWAAYSVSISLQTAVIKLWRAADGTITQVTRPVLRDFAPAFDPQGRYLYFLSYRTFNPVYDALHFELSFPRAVKPYLITLRRDLPSPFLPWPPTDEAPKDEKKEDRSEANATDSATGASEETPSKEGEKDESEKVSSGGGASGIHIDLEGIQERVIAFPVKEAVYGRIQGIHDGKVIYSRYTAQDATEENDASVESLRDGLLVLYNFEEQKEETLVSGISDFVVSANGKMLLYNSGSRLRVIKAGEKPVNDSYGFNRKTGWLDLSRVKIEVVPGAEWRQMFREAWRLQRDQFWSEDMSQVDWLSIYERYLPLVDRVGSRSEFSDLMWEMQGELGTSHAYEMGGDYRPTPRYNQGYLGADLEFDAQAGAWRIAHIYRGDVWDEHLDSPLRQPGVNAREGDYLLAINGKRLSRRFLPSMALVNQAGEEISLVLAAGQEEVEKDETNPGAKKPFGAERMTLTRALRDETPARYREWVENNRQRVHEASQGRIGYVHIPDMGPMGYAEFHRGYLAEVDRDGLIVDVRFNTGGHVSSLILEKLARRRLAYVTSRWMQAPRPYPHYAIAGPIVALINEFTGSDGDIFAHAFKLMKIGPLIGKRTWGGVIGIQLSRTLIDGAIITQPEYAHWFSDVGLSLENRGEEPDIEVEILPQDYAQGRDPQLERAIEEALRLLERNPPQPPIFGPKPNQAAPRLPKS